MTRSRPAKSYLLHGLCVRSELLLAAREIGGPLHDVAITIGQTRPVPDLPPAGRLLSHIDLPTGSCSLVTRDSRYILRVHRYCDFELSDGLGSICAHLPPHLDEEYASLLVGGVLATVLTLKGCSVLHASAVEVSGQVVAFVAGSGMGKTTLAALCCASGAKLVTDDVLRIETARDGGWCFAGTSELRLRPPLADLAESLSDGPSQSTVDERYSAGPPA